MATTMTIDGQSLGPDFPTIARAQENVRLTEDGPTYCKVTLTLTGFRLGDTLAETENAIQAIRSIFAKNRVTVSITLDGVTMYTNKVMYVIGNNEPDAWRQYDAEFSIQLFYYEEASANGFSGLTASFAGYTFPTMPSWRRATSNNRSDETDTLNQGRNRVDITLSGFILVSGINDALYKMAELEDKVTGNNSVGTLNYGNFTQTCYVDKYEIGECLPENKIVYTINLYYFSSSIIRVQATTRISRVNNNPQIKEKPGCNSRSITLGNLSGQTLVYDVQVKATSLSAAREQAGTELAARMISGGLEMPGGQETQVEESNTVSVSAIRYYDTPVVSNL